MSNKGKRAENELVNQINGNTPRYILAIPAGYSGNHGGASPDIAIIDFSGIHVYGIELKTHNAGQTAKFERSYDPEHPEDLDQMEILERAGMPMYAAVNWSRAEMGMWRSGPEEAGQTLVENTPDKFNPRVAEKSGIFRVDNPRANERGVHPSARSGRPKWKVVVDTLGLDERNTVESGASERASAC